MVTQQVGGVKAASDAIARRISSGFAESGREAVHRGARGCHRPAGAVQKRRPKAPSGWSQPNAASAASLVRRCSTAHRSRRYLRGTPSAGVPTRVRTSLRWRRLRAGASTTRAQSPLAHIHDHMPGGIRRPDRAAWQVTIRARQSAATLRRRRSRYACRMSGGNGRHFRSHRFVSQDAAWAWQLLISLYDRN